MSVKHFDQSLSADVNDYQLSGTPRALSAPPMITPQSLASLTPAVQDTHQHNILQAKSAVHSH